MLPRFELPYTKSTSIGLFQTLEQKIKLNPHSIGAIRIRATDPCFPGEDRFWLLCSIEGSGSYISLNIPNAFIQFDLRKYHIHPTHYLIEYCPLVNIRNLCWVIEGSTNGCKWICLDERRLESSTNLISVFECHSLNFCRFIRMKQTGLNSVKGYQLVLRRFELFGSVEFHKNASIALDTAGFV
jgi:hypothetical protein